ncbi:TOMM precursor leader peptide-binding protein [Paenibacillus frigoriresistens]|uniref:TOMM precursor leader peptide-binding protein n=1 Tax=Paenibacillus alginolyticus TaxID=59839 RepID=UPI001563863F|nr:TOMM precursor leader peptide-binding protein [Paenibacillus frigoriresistens]NRF95763.1 TOMM precursor leader peptide-binding protein [Paenibacillus frigoriresistens]
MNAIISVVGEGLLADFVCGKLSDRYQVVRQTDFTSAIPKAAKLVVVLHDDWPSSGYFEAEEALQQAGIPWLRGFISMDEGIVGPLVRPGAPGCSQCADNRRFTASPGDIQRAVRSSPSGLWHVTHLLIAETQRVLRGSRAHTEEHMYIVNLKTLNSSLHFILPDPLCPVCGRLPDDSSAAAKISLKPRPKISADSYRCRPIDDLKQHLAKDYMDSRTGVFNAKMHDLVSPFAGVGVNLPSFLMGDEVTGGRSFSYAESELTAILEGLERYCGIAPRGKRTVIYDSFNRVADHALDPSKVGLYSKEQYAQPDFTFEPFDPDLPIDWIWGYSLVRKCPILVPESLAYYSSGFGGGFVQEGSNGCALGGSLEEAVLYGILEVAERDSFLMTWYAQLPIPRLDPYSANDQELRLMIERLRAVAGYDVYLFNMTMENGIPSIWALAKSVSPGKMNLICAAGAHLDPVRAAKSAIHELAGMLIFLQENFEAGRERFMRMLDDPFLVRQMEDHVMLYGLPQAEERLQFLLDGQRPLRTFDEEFKRKASHADLTDDLKDTIEVFRRLNLDVIAVDQSSQETLRNGLHCVKVLIPGMLPMTFGHHLQRLTGLERALRVPAELGYAKEPLTVRQLNPHPHPFL